MRENWRRLLSHAGVRVVLAEVDRAGIGLAGTEPPWLQGLYVLPSAWGTGVAGRLHDEALSAISGAGCTHARLWVLEHNRRARSFYERRGWRPDGSSRVVPFPPEPVDVGYTLSLSGD